MRTITSFIVGVLVYVTLVLIPYGLWQLMIPEVSPGGGTIAVYLVYMYLCIYPTKLILDSFHAEMGWFMLIPLFLFSSCGHQEYIVTKRCVAGASMERYGNKPSDLDQAQIEAWSTKDCLWSVLEGIHSDGTRDTLYWWERTIDYEHE